jgi:hypothetical protein
MVTVEIRHFWCDEIAALGLFLKIELLQLSFETGKQNYKKEKEDL